MPLKASSTGLGNEGEKPTTALDSGKGRKRGSEEEEEGERSGRGQQRRASGVKHFWAVPRTDLQ
jgi:hypothetical protein